MVENDEINYRSLRHLQQLEKNSPILTTISSDFYEKLSQYLQNLDNRLAKENNSSPKYKLLNEEIRNTKKIASSIYEQREKKILLAAISKARGGNPDLTNLTDIEKNLFDSILDSIVKTRKRIFEKNDKFVEKSTDPLNKKEKGGETKKEEDSPNTNPVILISENIPEFVGTDMKRYNLRKGDVLSVPEDLKNILSKRDVAEEVKKH